VTKTLNSWKEIASYLNSGVRTVQRWELLRGLPVRRVSGRQRSAVYALSHELDEWHRRTKSHLYDDPWAAERRIAELEEELRRLTNQLSAAQQPPRREA
jgi:hypothetical protein